MGLLRRIAPFMPHNNKGLFGVTEQNLGLGNGNGA